MELEWYAKPINKRVELKPISGIRIVFKRERYGNKVILIRITSNSVLQLTEQQFHELHDAIRETLEKIKNEGIL